MPGKSKIRFKSLEFKDLEKVMEIETLSNPTPWSIGSFIDCINSSYQNIVILSDNLLVGFCISTVNFTESHLLNISIHPDYRSQGLGQLLLDESERELNKKGVSDVFLEVRNSNISAINYYRSSDGREDGLIFTKHMHLSSFASISRFSIFFLRKIISFDRG